ncbi:hypothetical protein PENTCL1PPCAC_549 [Pristionchus entomophagus]|uniref:G protein-coupled receptor n=1 Tax=Pristionchus entomophagus TaxID=358040 RepID=A0AAV5SAY5_9BILA|nr:hypothetical protein PENTCL1PPCAC_549 [Pristionchus entomophagus]
MKIAAGLAHALIIVAFPLQLVFCFVFSRTYGFVLLFSASVVVHVMYYQRVIKGGQRQYRDHFFYYEIVVAGSQVFMVATHTTSIATSEFWMMVVPLAVQVATCVALYVYRRQCQKEPPSDELPFYIDDRENGRPWMTHHEFPVVHKRDLI